MCSQCECRAIIHAGVSDRLFSHSRLCSIKVAFVETCALGGMPPRNQVVSIPREMRLFLLRHPAVKLWEVVCISLRVASPLSCAVVDQRMSVRLMAEDDETLEFFTPFRHDVYRFDMVRVVVDTQPPDLDLGPNVDGVIMAVQPLIRTISKTYFYMLFPLYHPGAFSLTRPGVGHSASEDPLPADAAVSAPQDPPPADAPEPSAAEHEQEQGLSPRASEPEQEQEERQGQTNQEGEGAAEEDEASGASQAAKRPKTIEMQ